MDGTLLDDENRVDKLLKKLMPAIEQADIHIGIATGRLDYMVYGYQQELGLTMPIISCNGALIREYGQKEPLFASYMPIEKIEQIIAILQKEELDFHLYLPKGVSGLTDTNRIAYFRELNKSLTPRNQIPLFIGPSIMQKKELTEVLKILVIIPDEQKLERMRVELQDPKLTIVSSATGLLDIMARGNTKGHALEQLQKMGRLDLAQTLAFGDNENDIEMLEVAKTGIAMANAKTEVIAMADEQTASNTENGVGVYMKELLKRY